MTTLRKVETVDEQFAVVTYEAVRDGVVLGTITKYDEPAWKVKRNGKVHNFREIGWVNSRDPGLGYDTRTDALRGLEK